MRVIAGEYRRRTLVAPRGLDTRPTSDRLRETLFNVLAPRLSGSSFLDLYAGSGANGIEALSRGAARVVFVEQAAAALATLRANVATLQVPASRYLVEPRAVSTWVRHTAAMMPAAVMAAAGGQAAAGQAAVEPATACFDLIFLDPPYDAAKEYAGTLGLLGDQARSLLAPQAWVIAEHRRTRRGLSVNGPAERHGQLERTRLLEQGDAALSFYVSRAASTATHEASSTSETI